MEHLIIGKIINTHGVKGELKIQPLTDYITRFKDLELVYIGPKKEEEIVESVRFHKEFALLTLRGYKNINEVLKYKGNYIYIDKEERLELPEDSFYIFDLIDIRVYTMDDEYVGKITDVLQGPVNDVYVIAGNSGEIMIPAVREFIKEVDIDNKLMKIEPIEGMI